MNHNTLSQPNPEVEAAKSVLGMLWLAARAEGATPDQSGVFRFDLGNVHVDIHGEHDPGPHSDDPWMANVVGELAHGQSTKSVRVTLNGLRGTDCGFDDDGTDEPLTTEQSIDFIAAACGRSGQLAA